MSNVDISKSSKKVQTIIHVFPHVLDDDDETATAFCDRAILTAASTSPSVDNREFYTLLQFIPYKQIEEDCIRIIDLPRKQRLQWHLESEANVSHHNLAKEDSGVFSQKGVLRKDSPTRINSRLHFPPVHKRSVTETETQTDLFVGPCVPEDEEVAIVRTNLNIQTSLSLSFSDCKKESLDFILNEIIEGVITMSQEEKGKPCPALRSSKEECDTDKAASSAFKSCEEVRIDAALEETIKKFEEAMQEKFLRAFDAYLKRLESALDRVVNSYINKDAMPGSSRACICSGNDENQATSKMAKSDGKVGQTRVICKRTSFERVDDTIRENVEEYISTQTEYPVEMTPANMNLSIHEVSPAPCCSVAPERVIGDTKAVKTAPNIDCECHPTEAGGAVPTIAAITEQDGKEFECICGSPVPGTSNLWCTCTPSNSQTELPQPNDACCCSQQETTPSISGKGSSQNFSSCCCSALDGPSSDSNRVCKVQLDQKFCKSLIKAWAIILGKLVIVECVLVEARSNDDMENNLVITGNVTYPHVKHTQLGASSIVDIEPKKGCCAKKKPPPPPPPKPVAIRPPPDGDTCTRCAKQAQRTRPEIFETGKVVSSAKQSETIEEFDAVVEIECSVVVSPKPKRVESKSSCICEDSETVVNQGVSDGDAGVQTDIALGHKLESTSLNSLCECDSVAMLPGQNVPLQGFTSYMVDSVALKFTNYTEETITEMGLTSLGIDDSRQVNVVDSAFRSIRDQIESLVFKTKIIKMASEEDRENIPIEAILPPKPSTESDEVGSTFCECFKDEPSSEALAICKFDEGMPTQTSKARMRQEGVGFTVDFYMEPYPSNMISVPDGASSQPNVSVCSNMSEGCHRPKRCPKDIAIKISVNASKHRVRTAPSSVIISIKSSTDCPYQSEVIDPANEELRNKQSTLLRVVTPLCGKDSRATPSGTVHKVRTTVSFKHLDSEAGRKVSSHTACTANKSSKTSTSRNKMSLKDFKEDPVGAALKAYDAEMKPLRETLKQLRDKIKKLNLTELQAFQTDSQRQLPILGPLPKTFRSKVFVSKEPYANNRTVIRMKPRSYRTTTVVPNSTETGICPNSSVIPPTPTPSPNFDFPCGQPTTQTVPPHEFINCPFHYPQMPYPYPPFFQQLLPPQPGGQQPQNFNFIPPYFAGQYPPFSPFMAPPAPEPVLCGSNHGGCAPQETPSYVQQERMSSPLCSRYHGAAREPATQTQQHGMCPDCQGQTCSDENVAHEESDTYVYPGRSESNKRRFNDYNYSDADDSEEEEGSSCPFIELLRGISKKSLINHGYASSSRRHRRNRPYQPTSREILECENLILGQAIRTSPDSASTRPSCSKKKSSADRCSQNKKCSN